MHDPVVSELVGVGEAKDDFIKRTTEFMRKVYTALKIETGEDPYLLSPDLMIENGKIFILELNLGLFSYSAHLQFPEIKDRIMPKFFDLIVARAKEKSARVNGESL